MSDLRNRGQYSRSIEEEFEFLNNRISELEAELLDGDGQASGGTMIGGVVDIYYGDAAVNNGNSTGQSTLPRSFPKASSILIHLGSTITSAGGSNGENTDIQIDLNADGLHVDANRAGTVGDGNVNYVVIRVNLVDLAE